MIQDSGDRTEFQSGALKDMPENKGRYDLIPARAIRRLALHYEKALAKYPERNWEKGIPIHCYLDSALRHLFKLLDGQNDEDHAAAVMWNMSAYIHHTELVALGKLPASLAKGLPFMCKACGRETQYSDGLCQGCIDAGSLHCTQAPEAEQFRKDAKAFADAGLIAAKAIANHIDSKIAEEIKTSGKQYVCANCGKSMSMPSMSMWHGASVCTDCADRLRGHING